MKAPIKYPTTPPASGVAVAAVDGQFSGVLLQDDRGNQIFVTPKLARQLSKQMPEIANVADGKVEPDLSKGRIVSFPDTMLM
jgi:hypothetical protein